MLPEQGPYLVAGTATVDNASFTTNIDIHSDPAAVLLGCVVLLDTGSPQIFLNGQDLKSMKTAVAASVVCERRTPLRSWGVLGKSPPLQTDTFA